MFEQRTDSKGQRYVNVGNVRITEVQGGDRWAGQAAPRYLRVQSYKEAPGASGLNMGAELPIASAADAMWLAAAILALAAEMFAATDA